MARYLCNFNMVLRQQMAYRGDFYARLVGILLRMSVYFYLWQVVGGTASDLNARQLTTYSVLGILLSVALFSNASYKMGSALRDGSIITRLLRPVDLQLSMMVESLGETLYRLISSGLPLYGAACLLFQVQAPASAGHALAFLFSAACGALVAAAFSYLMGVLTFWTSNDWGLTVFQRVFIQSFSGALVPLTLLPGWLQQAVHWLPFQAMAHQPIMIYQGQFTLLQSCASIAGQLAWAVGLMLLGRVLAAGAVAQLTFQGG